MVTFVNDNVSWSWKKTMDKYNTKNESVSKLIKRDTESVARYNVVMEMYHRQMEAYYELEHTTDLGRQAYFRAKVLELGTNLELIAEKNEENVVRKASLLCNRVM